MNRIVIVAVSLIAALVILDTAERRMQPARAQFAGPPNPYEPPEHAMRLSSPLRCPEQWVEQSPPLTRACVSVHLELKK